MAIRIRRREFIVALGGAARSRAADAPVPVIGFISAGSPEAYPQALPAFRKVRSVPVTCC
jgi:hypothetical protein